MLGDQGAQFGYKILRIVLNVERYPLGAERIRSADATFTGDRDKKSFLANGSFVSSQSSAEFNFCNFILTNV